YAGRDPTRAMRLLVWLRREWDAHESTPRHLPAARPFPVTAQMPPTARIRHVPPLASPRSDDCHGAPPHVQTPRWTPASWRDHWRRTETDLPGNPAPPPEPAGEP